MSGALAAIFAPGFFTSQIVAVAAIVSGVAAITCGSVGVFTVIRGQSFAGEALGDIGTSGGSGSYLLGVGLLWGYGVAAVAGVAVMELIGIQRPRGRDLATGIVLGAALGLAALFLYLGHRLRLHNRRDRHDRLRLDVRDREQRDSVGDRARAWSRSAWSGCSAARCC